MRRMLISIILLSAVATAPVIAQDGGLTLRVEKLEKEMKAIQRRVFPNGQPIQPEISTGTDGSGGGSSSAVADLTARVDALEGQLKQLTGQVESQGARLSRLEEQQKATRADFDARLKKLETPEQIGGSARGDDEEPEPQPQPVRVTKPTPAPPKADPKPVTKTAQASTPAAVVPKTSASKTDAKRKALIDAVEIPRTGDQGEDAYVYGHRLWTAKLYPEAQVQLKQVISKYPKHKRAAHARNLLGKAYLDEGKPALASVAFFEHYDKFPESERADDSLYHLGISLTRLNKLTDACRVFDEFGKVFGKTASAALKAKVAKGRVDAKCSA